MDCVRAFSSSSVLGRMGVVSAPKLSTLHNGSSRGALSFVDGIHPSTIVVLFARSITRGALSIIHQFGTNSGFDPLGTVNMLSGVSIL